MSDDNFVKALESHVNVLHMESVRPLKNVSNISLLESAATSGTLYSKKKKNVDSQALAKRWNIDVKKARNTIQRTTQRGVTTCLYPSMRRRLITNDHSRRNAVALEHQG